MHGWGPLWEFLFSQDLTVYYIIINYIIGIQEYSSLLLTEGDFSKIMWDENFQCEKCDFLKFVFVFLGVEKMWFLNMG